MHPDDTADTDIPSDTGDLSTQYVEDYDALWSVSAYTAGYDLGTADLDGDGQDELFIPGLFYDTSDYSSEVYAYVIPGATALASSRREHPHTDGVVTLKDDLTLGGDCAYPLTFGAVGDLDGDGVADVAFPQPTCREGPFVFWGATLSSAGFPDGEALTSEADLTVDSAGGADDYDALRLSANGTSSTEGSLQVAAWNWSEIGTTTWIYSLPVTGSNLSLDEAESTLMLSTSVEPAGEADLDGDGVNELLEVTASQRDDIGDPWRLHLFDLPVDGSTVTETDARATVVDSSSAYNPFAPVLFPGDLDRDGLDDIVVSHTCHDGGDGGCHGLVAGLLSASTLAGTVKLVDVAAWSITGDEDYSNVGADAALVPDVDGDGVSEILVPAWQHGTYYTVYEVFESALLAVGGSFGEADAIRTYLSVAGDEAGSQVGAGDLDGDGNPELVFERLYFDVDGGAYIFSW